MISKEKALEKLASGACNPAALELLLKDTLDSLLDVSEARGGCVVVIDQAGTQTTTRRKFTREAYKVVAELVGSGGSGTRGAMAVKRRGTTKGELYIIPFELSDKEGGVAALEFSRSQELPNKDDINFLGSITGILAGKVAILKKTEEIKKRSEEYQRVFEKAPIGIFIFDRKGNLTSINPFHMSHVSPHKGRELIQSTNVLKDESIKQAGLLPYFRKLLRGEAFELFNHPYTTKYMRRDVFVDVRGVPLRGHDERIEGGIVLVSNVTEKARLEMELRASRDYLNNIINSIDSEIAVVDRDHNLLLVNRSYANYSDGNVNSVLGQKCFAVSHNNIRPCITENCKCPLLQVFEEGVSRTTIHNHAGEGGPRIMEINYSPLFGSDGKVINVIIVAHDITERVKLEEEREKAREELNAVFEGITDSIMVINRELNVVKANKGSAELFRIPTNEIVGRKCHSIVRGTEEACWQCPVEESFELGKPFLNQDCKMVIAGENVFADIFTYPLFGPRGKIEQIVLYIRDVTERKVLEQKVRNREALLANISSDSADAIFSLDNEEIITSWNSGAQKIFGYSENDVIGKNVELLIPDEEKKEQLQQMRERVYGEGFVRNFETRWLTKDRREVDVIITRTTLRGVSNTVVGSSIIIKDISRIKEMTSELLHVEKLALLGKMSATVAHEIRNPLGSITLNLDLLEEEVTANGRSDPMIPQLISSIRSELKRLSLLADDYLRFTRYPKLHLEEVGLDELVTSAVSSLKQQLESQGVDLRVYSDKNRATITVDEHQIVQAIRNLLINASEAMPDPGRITVKQGVSGGFAVIRVSDTGTGIQSGELGMIFDPFFTTKDKGTGLGLSIVKQIAELHGGRIECESSQGQGSSFTLYLPLTVKRGAEAR